MDDDVAHGRELLERAVRASKRAPIAQALPLFREAEQAYEQAARPAAAAGVLVERARALAATFGRRNLAAAHAALDRAEQRLGETPDGPTRARLLHVRGYAYLRAGRIAEATRLLQRAESAFRDVGDASGEAQALDTLGVLWERSADRERAAMLFARSYALKQREGDRAGLAITLGNLGRLALHGGRIEEAVEFFQLDLGLARSLKDPRGEAVVLTNLAECALAQGRTDDARVRARAVLDIATAIAQPVTRGYALAVLAEAERIDGDLEAADEQVRASEDAFLEASMAAGIAHARITRARIQADAGQQDGSARTYVGAVRAARAAGVHDLAIEALLGAHTTFVDLKQPNRAARCLARAQDTAIRSGFPDLVDRVRRRQLGVAVSEAAVGGEACIAIDQAAGPLADRVGSTVRLRIDGYLGQGAFAVVLRVVDPQTGASFALKRLNQSRERMRALTHRLRREFTAMARVADHPGLVRPLAFGHEDGRPCLLLELIVSRDRHGSLEALMQDSGRLPVPVVGRLGAQVANGLAGLHAEGVVHRDVKPSNVLLNESGAAVLTDYGLAYDMEESAYVPASGFTGTLGYAAPELFRGDGEWRAPTPAADLYALGVVLFQCLAGSWPFRPRSLAGMIKAKLEADYEWELLDGTPRELIQLVRDLLSADPHARPDDAAGVAAKLAVFAGDRT